MDRTNLFKEVETIQDNCTFTAETHHQIAHSCRRQSIWLKIAPAVVAAVLGVLAANGVLPNLLIWLTVVAVAISAIANVVDPDKQYQSHLNAARAFTVLKHDVRALRESFADSMTDEQLSQEVQYSHRRYSDLVRLMPPTDDKAFERARRRIKDGVHQQSNGV